MVNKLKNALANITIQEDDQQFITNITILLEYTTIYIIPIVARLFIWNDLFSNVTPKSSIYYALDLLLNNAYQTILMMFCLTIIIDISFSIFTVILIYRKTKWKCLIRKSSHFKYWQYQLRYRNWLLRSIINQERIC